MGLVTNTADPTGGSSSSSAGADDTTLWDTEESSASTTGLVNLFVFTVHFIEGGIIGESEATTSGMDTTTVGITGN